jgi:hypothetical protein
MTKSIDHDDEPKHKHEHGPKEDERQRRPRREREDSGDDPKRHATIIERRWQGSPPPTAERYAKALQQWRKLPGAVSRPATDVTPPDEKRANTNSAGKESES